MCNYNIKRFYSAQRFAESCIDELATIAYNKNSEIGIISIICKDRVAQNLFKMFSCISVDGFYFDYGYLDYDSIDYTKEFIITITNDGYINVAKAYDEDGNIKAYGGEDLIYVHEDCNSKIKLFLNDKCEEMIDFSIDEFDEEM